MKAVFFKCVVIPYQTLITDWKVGFVIRNVGQELELLNRIKIVLESKMNAFTSQNYNDSVSLFHRTKYQNSIYIRVKSKKCKVIRVKSKNFKDSMSLSNMHGPSRSNDGSNSISVNSGKKPHYDDSVSLGRKRRAGRGNNCDSPASVKIRHNKHLKESVVVSGKSK